MTTNSPAPVTDATLKGLRYSSAAVAALVLLQALLGAGVLINEDAVKDLHGILGMTTAGVAVIAAVFAVLWKAKSGNAGLMGHAIATAILCIAQVGLGEAEMAGLHVGLGFLVLIAGTSLAAIVFNKPGTVGNVDTDK